MYQRSSSVEGPSTNPRPSKAALQNIQAVCDLERLALDKRTRGERIGDAVSNHAGRAWFIAFHFVWFIVWMFLNSPFVSSGLQFDPYPYPFLTFTVSLEAIFLSLFILMSQNRAARQADQRAHLDLQINLLAESESTRTLEMLKLLCQHHGLAVGDDPEIEQLSQPTEPKALVKELQKQLPDSN